ncbi:hypothetical protein QLX08_001480 [Tetragonisca angustula]
MISTSWTKNFGSWFLLGRGKIHLEIRLYNGPLDHGSKQYRNLAHLRSTPVHTSSPTAEEVQTKPKQPIMKLLVAFALVVVAASAAPQGHQEDVLLVKETPSDNIGVGHYNYGYELSNGQAHQESAELLNAGTENESLAVRGSFTWVDPQTNVRYTVNYVADENGFQPQGDHIPA